MLDESVLRGTYLLLRRQWRIVCIATVGGGVLFILLSFLIVPRYRAEVVLAPQSNPSIDMMSGALAGQLGGLGSLLGMGMGRSSDDEFALAVLESTDFTRKFVVAENVRTLLQENANRAPASWRRLGFDAKLPSELRATRTFDLDIRTIIEDSQTGLVTLRIDWTDRVQAADWANKMAARLNETVRTRVIREASERMVQIRREMEAEDQIEVRGALARLLETELKRRAFATASLEYAFRVVDPAVAPDEGRYASPRRALLAAAGVVLGFLAGLMIAVLRAQQPASNRVQ